MASTIITCDICCSDIYVTDEEIESKADFGFFSDDKDTNVCQYCIRRIKSRYSLPNELAAMQIVKDFNRYELRTVLGLV